MKYNVIAFLAFFALPLFTATAQNNSNTEKYQYAGRMEHSGRNVIVLIGSASSVGFNFTGNECAISLKSQDSWEHHNYVSLELDGNYLGRLKVEKGESRSYPVMVKGDVNQKHRLVVYKATEASNGSVVFSGTTAHLIDDTAPEISKKKIEFIGNSITCGMGNDTKEIPCGKGEWFDQHNAYWAYGPILSRSLNVDFLLSSVSGIGMYRNWNDEHLNEAIMPDVYEKLYLNKDNAKKYDFKYQPDLVSICLGTNDLSEGDGKKPRLPFNKEKYVANYIAFIKMLYTHYPKTRIVLLTSPMVSGKRNTTFVKCLKKVIKAFKNDKEHEKIALFQYKPMTPNGCGSHPDIEDHKIMAEQLEPLFKKLLNEK